MIELQEIAQKTNALGLHSLGLTGKGVKVAILDSGIDVTHPFFEDITIESFNLTDEPLEDKYQHGTHVASILSFLAPGCHLINIKVLNQDGKSNISTIMRGIELAHQKGANIINISVGEPVYDCPDGHPLSKVIDFVTSKGVMIVCSAGNEGPRKSPYIPAACQNAVAVGSMNELMRTNKFSSRGPICERKYPDCVAFGDDIYAALPKDQFGLLSGSSQATPQISALLALVKEHFGSSFSKEQIDFFFSQSCSWIEGPDKNNSSGWGAIDMLKFFRAIQIHFEQF